MFEALFQTFEEPESGVALIARLPQGMSFQAAHARLVAACKQLDKAYPNEWGPQYAWSNNVEVVPVAGLLPVLQAHQTRTPLR